MDMNDEMKQKEVSEDEANENVTGGGAANGFMRLWFCLKCAQPFNTEEAANEHNKLTGHKIIFKDMM